MTEVSLCFAMLMLRVISIRIRTLEWLRFTYTSCDLDADADADAAVEQVPSEDPLLSSTYAREFIGAMQDDPPKPSALAATAAPQYCLTRTDIA
eukprot:COSAG01_NODE_21058_length_920_cov_1.866017_2_plen_94_part_00